MAELPEPLESLDIKLLQGASFSLDISVETGGVDWEGLTEGDITAEVNRSFGDATPLVAFTVTPHETETHRFVISLTAAQTSALTGNFGGSRTRETIIGVYDVKVVLVGVTYRLLQGNVTLSRGATL